MLLVNFLPVMPIGQFDVILFLKIPNARSVFSSLLMHQCLLVQEFSESAGQLPPGSMTNFTLCG